jgi:lipid kinase, YegS/Rv2252/BmrU family
MRACAIVNPAAGQGQVKRLWPELLPELRAATSDLAVCKTTGPGEATTLTRAALTEDYDRIVAVGGDGTLHEVVNGYFRPDGTALTPAPPLVPLSCGTGTDFNRMLGQKIGLNAVSYLRSDRVRPVDLLRLEYTDRDGDSASRHALNITSLGLSSAVVRSVNRGGLPLPGGLRYFGAIMRALSAHAPFEVAITLDDEVLGEGPVRLVAIANGHTFGAGVKIAPNAVVDDGRLDLTILHDISAFRLLRSLPRFYDGRHVSLDGVSTHRGRRLTVRPFTDGPVWLEADGELVGQLPVTVEVVPDAIQLQY